MATGEVTDVILKRRTRLVRPIVLRLVLPLSLITPAAAAPGPTPRVVHGQPAQNLLGQFIIGWAAGFGAGYGGAKLGAAVLGPRGGEDPGLLGGLFGLAAGIVLGTSTAVYGVARGQGVPSEYATALGGAMLGLVAVAPLFKTGDALGIEVSEPVVWAMVFALPAAGAVFLTDLSYRGRQRDGRITAVVASTPSGWTLGMNVPF
jgi:hypothetical protein